MRKSSKPKSTTRIVTRKKSTSMPDIQLPEMSGMGDGLGDGIGGGFDMMPDLGDVSVFGSGQSIGNDFEGTFYSLKYARSGRLITMSKEQFLLILRHFATHDWKESLLSKYYRAPKKLYTTHFMVPDIPAPLAPDIFGQPEMESYWFFVKYKGKLVYPEDIKFRFWGIGDAYALVRVGGKNVFVNGVPKRLRVLDYWQSFCADSDKYHLGHHYMKVGDWIELKAGEPMDMEVLYGEWEGGMVACMLLVEVYGEEYPKSDQGGPLLPAFKTEEFTQDQLENIRKYLAPGEACLTNGPVFRDYIVESRSTEKGAEPVEPAVEPVAMSREEAIEMDMCPWALKNGKTINGEFITLINGNVTLKGEKGRLKKIPEQEFSKEDMSRIELMLPPKLDLEFSRKTKQRRFPETHTRNIPSGVYYTFTARIKQTSPRPYPHGLTAEFFAIADEIDGDNRILIDYQKESFNLPDGSGSTFEMSGRTVQLLDYITRDFRRGEKYKGYMIVVTDSREEIIAHKASSDNFFANLDNLRKVPVGKYFDKHCNRTSPTRQKKDY